MYVVFCNKMEYNKTIIQRRCFMAAIIRVDIYGNTTYIRWTFVKPIIEALKHFGGSATPSEVVDYVAKTENISKKFLEEKTSIGKNKFYYTLCFIKVSLVKIGYIESSQRGVWQITELGKNAIITSSLAQAIVKESNNRLNDEISYTQEDSSYEEGKLLLKEHVKRERNSTLIKKAKELFIKKHGHLFCQSCGFDFEKTYGELGRNFIEAHHVKPVSQLKEGEKTKVSDIKMLCSNCHSMIHRDARAFNLLCFKDKI